MTGAQAGPLTAVDTAVSKTRWRLLPMLVLMYVLAFVDRSNVGFAKSLLQADTGLSDAAFAFGAGVFFMGYALFEVPSNLILYRVGARRWLSRIMVSWGLVSACMAFTRDANSFYLLRFLLGAAEAGFFPGIILYLTQWFPARVRGEALGVFYYGIPLAQVLGSPVSGLLLQVQGPLGLRPWQVLFLVEGLLASVCGLVAYFYLVDRPASAGWLKAPEREALTQVLDAEDRGKRDHSPATLWATLGNRRVLLYCLIYFGIQISVYGVVFYLPSRLAGVSGERMGAVVGLLAAIPWAAALGAIAVFARRADRSGRHRNWAAAFLLIGSLALATSALLGSVTGVVLAFSVAVAGFMAAQPLYWVLPTDELRGTAAAGGIATINSIGNLGGFVAPNLKTVVEQASGRPEAGMLVLALGGLAAAVLLWALRTPARPVVPG
jgi:sugar phosphate permease